MCSSDLGGLAVDAVARRRHVGPAGQQRDAGRLAVRPGPGDGLNCIILSFIFSIIIVKENKFYLYFSDF